MYRIISAIWGLFLRFINRTKNNHLMNYKLAVRLQAVFNQAS
jgi:hypothetical protein